MVASDLSSTGAAARLDASARRGLVIPASFFGIVLGLVGLGNTWRVASRLWSLPVWIGEAVMLLATGVWASLLLLYVSKWIWHRKEALAESGDSVQWFFIALLPVSTMLVALAVIPYSRSSAICLFAAGILGTVTFSVWCYGGLWRGGLNPASATPGMYLPMVAGNFVVAIVAGSLGWAGWGRLFFGAGLFSWLALESVILYRLLVIEKLAASVRPALGIQLAPPAVGLVAYLSVTDGEPGLFAQMLLGYALLHGLILLRLLPWIGEQPFAAGYWAFTFGITALSLGTARLVERGVMSPATELAPILFIIANLAIGGITAGSIVLLARGQLLSPAASK